MVYLYFKLIIIIIFDDIQKIHQFIIDFFF